MKLIHCLLFAFVSDVIAVKVKVTMHSEPEDSRTDDEEPHTEYSDAKKKIDITMLPFLKKSHRRVEEKMEYEEEKPTTEKSRQMHPNELIFPLIYRQNHVSSMFKFGENWYTWSAEKRADGSRGTNYYICYDEPKRCDDIGWEHTDALPKCAFQIDSLMADDRACVNTFGVEPHVSGLCDGGEQMKVSEIVRSCGPRIRSLWRFVRAGVRPVGVPKPADVNSLLCEDEEECYITIEYRIHHDRITFSLSEPTRGQTFKSALKRDLPSEDDNKVTAVTAARPRVGRRGNKFHPRARSKPSEGKEVVKERNDSAYAKKSVHKNKIKVREDISENLSD